MPEPSAAHWAYEGAARRSTNNGRRDGWKTRAGQAATDCWDCPNVGLHFEAELIGSEGNGGKEGGIILDLAA